MFRSALFSGLTAALALSGASLSVVYPENGSIFPPEFPAPTFLWRDDSGAARWQIEIAFADGLPAIRRQSPGPRLRVGPIDPDCAADTNEPPKLAPEFAAARTWTPDSATWQAIKRRSTANPAVVTIAGFRAGDPAREVSRGHVSIQTSKDRVGAPIFYRDVPLMPSEVEKGVIKPLAAAAIPLVAWRLRDPSETRSRVVMEGLPVCANCHSFSADGKTLGMDLDGLHGNRGMYIFTSVAPRTEVRSQDVVQWSTREGKLEGKVRIGFMSQVSPNGEYVVTTINPVPGETGANGRRSEPPSNYYVANFKDYRFLQVFFPTRGILGWYTRAAGVLQPLPGADDPRFVQMGAVWSPDGRYLVYARAEARDPNPPGAPEARFSGDPNELQIRYDLYRIPFRDGKGGEPEPIAGASENGFSNTFPKISPDGRWIVFVRCRNGQLMRPDSELHIVPAAGGVARRMRANTKLMNSWHSFSPNGRWLVFSSKARSPYTQLYLTHLDEDGNDSPPILIENTTASNRAANIPEFVNIPPGGLREIGGEVLDYYRLINRATYLGKRGRYEEAAARWRQVLAIRPDDETAHRNLGAVLLAMGKRSEAAEHRQKADEMKLRKAVDEDPRNARAHNELGKLLLDGGRVDEAAGQFEEARSLQPDFAPARANLGRALGEQGKLDEALVELRAAVARDDEHAPAHYYLGTILNRQGNAAGAIEEWQRAVALDPKYVEAHASLADALEAEGQSAEALAHWRAALEIAPDSVTVLRAAAWVLATSPDAALRDGKQAVALAARAMQLSAGKDPVVVDTLAAAYAEQGRFVEAALSARRAVALATQAGRITLAEAIRERLSLYERETAFRDR